MSNQKKFNEVMKEKQENILREYTNNQQNLSHVMQELQEVISMCDREEIDVSNISFEVYWRNLVIEGIKDKEVYEALLIGLTELYGDGERAKHWSNDIQYSFRVDHNPSSSNMHSRSIEVNLRVAPKLSGCTITEKQVLMPAVEARLETQYTVVCNETDTD